MKVLIVQPSMGFYGGAERVIVNLANHLTDNHNPTTILTTQMDEDVRADLKDARLVFAKDFNDLREKIEKIYKDFDVINPHNYPAHLIMHGKPRPTVWMCNEPSPDYFATGDVIPADKAITNEFIDKIVVADAFNYNRVNDIYDRMADAVIPYGIEADFFENGNGKWIRAKNNLEGKYIIVHTGFIHPQKNQMATVEALAKVKKTIPEAVAIFAGMHDRNYLMEVVGRATELGVEDDIIIMPFEDQEFIRDLYHTADVIVHPIHSQGGWLSVFDSICTGKPVIVSSEFTGADILTENDLAVVCPNETLHTELANCFKLKCGGKERKVAWIKENLNWQKFCENFEKVLKSCVS